jgi:carbon monoxide dehydrogenase subunit G
MGVSKYVSQVKHINQNNQTIFNFLSDFNNLGKFFNNFTLEQLSQKVPGASINDFSSDDDSCRFNISKFGEAGFRIIEREPYKTIKITGEGKIPFQMYIWIQILPTSAYQSKIRLTLHADMSFVIKAMIGKKMQEGVDNLAHALTVLPYH